jgi:hypothetical protein
MISNAVRGFPLLTVQHFRVEAEQRLHHGPRLPQERLARRSPPEGASSEGECGGKPFLALTLVLPPDAPLFPVVLFLSGIMQCIHVVLDASFISDLSNNSEAISS